jgi:hypothetical protein
MSSMQRLKRQGRQFPRTKAYRRTVSLNCANNIITTYVRIYRKKYEGFISIENVWSTKNKKFKNHCGPRQRFDHLNIQCRGWDLAECGWDLTECGWDLTAWLELLTVNAEVATVGFNPSMHPPTRWNLRGDRWSSVEKSTYNFNVSNICSLLEYVKTQ